MTPKPYLIAIAGPSGAGKTYLAEHLVRRLKEAVILPIDAYYPDLSHLSLEQRAHLNFDDPALLDTRLLFTHLEALSNGQSVHRPVYDFARHTRTGEHVVIEPRQYVLIEGIFALYWPEVRQRIGTGVYVDLPDADALQRRIERDVRDRGRTPAYVQQQFETSVLPMAERFVRPSAAHAHVVVMGNSPIDTAVDAVLSHISQHRETWI